MSHKSIDNLILPLIVAPMFRVSSPELVIASCRSGVIGSFPNVNPRTVEEFDSWLSQINHGLKKFPDAAPYAVNLVVQNVRLSNESVNDRLRGDLKVIKSHKPPIVITSVGSPKKVIPHVHEYGGLVFSDVATLKHAHKAAELGVDGLVLLCSGAGGNSGWVNPFAFVRAVREFYDGYVVLAGSIMDGASIRAAEVLGADLVYMGTRFISSTESMAAIDYKQKLIEVNMDDIMTTKSFSGMPANYLRPSIEAAGFDPENLPTYSEFQSGEHRKKRWKEIWSAGQGVGAVKDIVPVSQLVNRLVVEYRA